MDEACASKVGSKGSPSPTCSFCTVSLVFRLAYLCRKITKIKTRERKEERRGPLHIVDFHVTSLYFTLSFGKKQRGKAGSVVLSLYDSRLYGVYGTTTAFFSSHLPFLAWRVSHYHYYFSASLFHPTTCLGLFTFLSLSFISKSKTHNILLYNKVTFQVA